MPADASAAAVFHVNPVACAEVGNVVSTGERRQSESNEDGEEISGRREDEGEQEEVNESVGLFPHSKRPVDGSRGTGECILMG